MEHWVSSHWGCNRFISYSLHIWWLAMLQIIHSSICALFSYYMLLIFWARTALVVQQKGENLVWYHISGVRHTSSGWKTKNLFHRGLQVIIKWTLLLDEILFDSRGKENNFSMKLTSKVWIQKNQKMSKVKDSGILCTTALWNHSSKQARCICGFCHRSRLCIIHLWGWVTLPSGMLHP